MQQATAEVSSRGAAPHQSLPAVVAAELTVYQRGAENQLSGNNDRIQSYVAHTFGGREQVFIAEDAP